MKQCLNILGVLTTLLLCLVISGCGRTSPDIEMKDMIYSHLRGPYEKKYEEAGITSSLHDTEEQKLHGLYQELGLHMKDIKRFEEVFSKIRKNSTVNTKIIVESGDNAKVEVEYTTYDGRKTLDEAMKNVEYEAQRKYGNILYVTSQNADAQLNEIGKELFVNNWIKSLENASLNHTNKIVIDCVYDHEKKIWIPNPEEYAKLHLSLITGSESSLYTDNNKNNSLTNEGAQKMIQGTWKRNSDGEIFKITDTSFGVASYEIREILQYGGRTVIRVALNHGKSVGEITILDTDHDHMTYENSNTGYKVEYTRQ